MRLQPDSNPTFSTSEGYPLSGALCVASWQDLDPFTADI